MMKLLAIAIVMTLLGGCTARESDDIVKLRLTQEFAKDERTFHECADWARESLGEDATAPEYMELTNSCLHMQTKLRASEADVEKKEQELEAAKRELQEARRQVEDTKGKLESERQRELAETKRELEEEKRKREAAERARQENNTSQSAPVIIVPSVPTPAPSPQTGGQGVSFELWQTYQQWVSIRLKWLEVRKSYWGKPSQFIEAMPLAKRALLLAEKLKGYDPVRGEEIFGGYVEEAESPDYFVVESLKDLAFLHERLADLNDDQDEYLSAVTLYNRAIKIQEKNFGKYHPKVADLLKSLAHAHSNQDERLLAIASYNRAIEIREASFGEHHPEVADVLLELAWEYTVQVDYSSALPLVRRAVDIREGAGFANSSDAFERYGMENALRVLAEVYSALNDYSSALPVYREWLVLRRNINRIDARKFEDKDEADGIIVAGALVGLARAHFELGQYNEALPAYHRANRIWKEQYRYDENSAVFFLLASDAWEGLARTHFELGQYDDALSTYYRAIEICEDVYGGAHSYRLELAKLYDKMGEANKAAAVRAGQLPDSNYKLYKLMEQGNGVARYEREGKSIYKRIGENGDIHDITEEEFNAAYRPASAGQ